MRKLLLPFCFNVQLEAIVSKKDRPNCNGLYICQPKPEKDGVLEYAVCASWLMSAKNHVVPDTMRALAFEHFFNMHREYAPVMWHKHPEKVYVFSREDLEFYLDMTRKNSKFMALLAYPENGRQVYRAFTEMLKSKNDAAFCVVPDPPGISGTEKYIEKLVLECAKDIGFDKIPPLEGL